MKWVTRTGVTRWLVACMGMAAVACGAPPAAENIHGVVSDIPGQDGVCSGSPFRDSECGIGCCDAHDRCYAEHGCRASSWLAGPAEHACMACNLAVVECLANGCDQGTPAAATAPQPCQASSECHGGQVCEDFDDDGHGQCASRYSGKTGDHCNNVVDCQSGLCVNRKCVLE